jgi:hypothetical protein
MRISHARVAASAALMSVIGVLGLAGAASASTTPPVPSSALFGTWVNTNSASNSVKQIDITRPKLTVVGAVPTGILVDAFGACVPTLCQWGLVPAILYGPDVSAATGTAFQTNQAFLTGTPSTEWSRTQLLGQLEVTPAGAPVLSVRELTAFEDSSGRHNYTQVETFVQGKGLTATVNGFGASGYPHGLAPSAAARLGGTWTASGSGVVKIKIGSGPSPVVRAFGACVPTLCDFGLTKAIAFGPSISSTSANVILAPYSFGFKNEQLLIKLYPGATSATDKLVVVNYNEFTDGSGRSNYVQTTTFTRA